MPTPGPLELIIILVIALLVLGPGKLPDVGSALGKSLREFRKAAGDLQEATKIDTSPLGSAPSAVPSAPAAPIQPAAAAPAPAQPAPAASGPAVPADAVPVAPVAVAPVAAAPVAAAPSSPDIPGGAGLSAPPQAGPSDQPRPESLS